VFQVLVLEETVEPPSQVSIEKEKKESKFDIICMKQRELFGIY